MKLIILFSIFLTFSSRLFSQIKEIKTFDNSTKEYYQDITFLTEGKSNLTNKNTDKESVIAYRLIIITSEIFDNLIIEKVSYGSEGGNKQIISKRKVDIDSLWHLFNLKGEISGIEFLKWISWNSF